MSVILSLLMLSAGVKSSAQSTPFPPAYSRLTAPADKAAFLLKVIRDSVAARALTQVPTFCHTALAFAAQTSRDTFSPILYRYLGDAYDGRLHDSAALYYRRALSTYQSPSLTDKIYLQQSLLYVYTALDARDSILAYIGALRESIASLPDTNSKKLTVMNTIATSYGSLNQYPAAIRAFRFVIANAKKTEDTPVLRNAFVNAGQAFNQTGDDRAAVYYTAQALPYMAGADPFDCMITYGNLGDYLVAVGSLDSARFFLQKLKALADSSGDEEAVQFAGTRRAALLIAEKKWSAAARFLDTALRFYGGKDPPGVEVVNCLLLYASLDTARGNFPAAEAHLTRLLAVTNSMNQRAYTAAALEGLAAVSEKLGKWPEAYRYLRRASAINDSIRTDQTAQSLAVLQTEYGTAQKEEQIKLLRGEARIRDLELRAALRNKTLLITLLLSILALSGAALYIRHLRSRAALRTVKADLEMKALRSQMNPHFIFNSLNSIQKYIWENKREDASEYLTTFARLIRLVLENSQHASVKLSEELAALRLYIEMEHRRANGGFDYSITVAPEVDTEGLAIPPLLLQPYVENAIWHGLSRKEGRGMLSVVIAIQNGLLVCSIVDDGIGRAQAALLKQARAAGTASLGTNISSQRIEWLKRSAGVEASVEILNTFTDRADAGTTVRITLPLATLPT